MYSSSSSSASALFTSSTSPFGVFSSASSFYGSSAPSFSPFGASSSSQSSRSISGKPIFSTPVNEKPLTDTEDDLRKRISFLSGFVVAFKDQIHTDIKLKPNNGPCISAHKSLLAARSEIFMNMLSSDNCKAPPTDTDTITLSELSTEELTSFLEFLYTGDLPADKFKKHVYALCVAADKYEIPYLQESCERYMLNSLNASNALDILDISNLHSKKNLKEKTLNFIVQNMKSIVSSQKYEEFASSNPHLSVEVTRAFVEAYEAWTRTRITASLFGPAPSFSQSSPSGSAKLTVTTPVNEKPLTDTEDDMRKRISFLSGFMMAFKDQIHTDIKLKPNNGPCISAHKSLLAARSEIFMNILSSDNCKAPPTDTDTITLSELSTEELKSFLEFLYTGDLPADKFKKHVYALCVAADKYEIPYLQESCERYMLNSLNASNALDILDISNLHSKKKLKETTLNFIVQNMKSIVSSQKYEEFASSNPHLSVEVTRAFVEAKF